MDPLTRLGELVRQGWVITIAPDQDPGKITLQGHRDTPECLTTTPRLTVDLAHQPEGEDAMAPEPLLSIGFRLLIWTIADQDRCTRVIH